MGKLHVSFRNQAFNNGPTTKRAFQDHQLLAEIVHAPPFVVVGLKTLFEAFNSGYFIHVERLEYFCKSWLRKFHTSEYQWNQMSPRRWLVYWDHQMLGFRQVPLSTKLLIQEIVVWRSSLRGLQFQIFSLNKHKNTKFWIEKFSQKGKGNIED